jgi:EmrB/QacA subfamily drug resistance transporter
VLVPAIGAFLAYLDTTVVNIAFPAIERSFPATSAAGLSWVLNGYFIVFAALLLPAGALGDVIGRRRLFAVGIGVFTLGSLLCATASSPALLVAARLLQGAGAALVSPTSLALLLALFPAGKRATVIGIWGGAAALAATLGPTVGGLAVHWGSWRWIFLINLPLGLAAMLLAPRLREPPGIRRERRLPDLLGSALFAACIGCVALVLVEGPSWGWTDTRILLAAAAALALVPVLARRLGHPVPVLDRELLRRGAARRANTGTLVFACAFYALVLCNILFLTTTWRYSILQAALAVTPGSLAGVVAAPLAGRAADRAGHARVIVVGLLLFVAGAVWLAVATGGHPEFLTDWLPGSIAVSVGGALAAPMLTGAALDALPARRFAAGSALNATARQLGAVLGLAVLVGLIGRRAPGGGLGAFHHAWLYIGAAALCTLPFCRLPRSGDEPA